jgi:CubicO group peptidase (beta-lactamase class C family)
MPQRDIVRVLLLMVVAGLQLVLPRQLPAFDSRGLPAAQGGPRDAAELAAWLDPLIEQTMQEAHIPGAVFVLVENGQVAYARGYGLADLARRTPVDVETSLWRVMSLSKPVTAVAIMQLAEQGKLDLHSDVNTYLRSVKLLEAFGAPITADHLLTHSAGLDYDLDDIGTEAAEPAGLVGNAQFLADHTPARVFPPGQHFLYSNAAFDIAGQVVEDVSGRPFADYVDQQIFQPLGMARSSFDQPPPQADGLVTGYEFDGAKLLRLPWPDYPRVSARSDGRLLVQFAPETETTHELIEVAPLHYRSGDGKLDYVFWQDATGRPAGFAVGDFVTEKVAPYDTNAAHILMLITFVGVFLASAVAGLVVSLRRPPTSPLARRTLWPLTAIAALNKAVSRCCCCSWPVDLPTCEPDPPAARSWLAAAEPLLTTQLAEQPFA